MLLTCCNPDYKLYVVGEGLPALFKRRGEDQWEGCTAERDASSLSLSHSLFPTEQSLLLICCIIKHRASPAKGIKSEAEDARATCKSDKAHYLLQATAGDL